MYVTKDVCDKLLEPVVKLICTLSFLVFVKLYTHGICIYTCTCTLLTVHCISNTLISIYWYMYFNSQHIAAFTSLSGLPH